MLQNRKIFNHTQNLNPKPILQFEKPNKKIIQAPKIDGNLPNLSYADVHIKLTI